MATTDRTPRSGPQTKLPALLFWLVVAALLFRIVTAVAGRGTKEGADAGAGLVKWRPLEKAAAAARREGKPVLYDFTAAWCQPCHKLDTEGWGDSGVATLVNDAYLPARIVDRGREDGKNTAAIEDLQRRYSVRAFPTLIVADADGREVAKMEGWAGRDGLVRFLEESRGKARK